MDGVDLGSATVRAEVEKGTPISGDNRGVVALCSVGNLVERAAKIWFGRTIIPF